MPSLKELKNRISSVKSTQKITRAMQMVAAAKLRRAEEAAAAGRPYAERMNEVLTGLGAAYQGRADAPKLLGGTGSDDTHLVVVATADRGLCGGFNSSIAKLARDHIRDLKKTGKTVKILCVGKKGYDILRRLYKADIVEMISLRDVKTLRYSNAQEIGEKVLAMFEAGEFDVATLFYSKFKSVISQVPTAQQLIPAQFDADDADGDTLEYDYEPDEEAILRDLLPRNVSVQIYSALLENGAGEMGAKMTAMDNATRNAGDMIDKLTLSYNRQRQAQITKELIEIISGAEAL
ncbi:F0F1 ATP synthase subunit gamma [Cucumibacter marinus]|uniref:F0F1 ATP synthase subunit gamma n=1 Tax=Cucumibacter marinus TaxID=1121252 RepID=UPI000418154A|nr:F0F1 ATP synthase subunit gamma [Cucumibacter marinus]